MRVVGAGLAFWAMRGMPRHTCPQLAPAAGAGCLPSQFPGPSQQQPRRQHQQRTRTANRNVQMGSAIAQRGSSCRPGRGELHHCWLVAKQACSGSSRAAAACCRHRKERMHMCTCSRAPQHQHAAQHLVPPDERARQRHTDGLHKVSNHVDDGACKHTDACHEAGGRAGHPPRPQQQQGGQQPRPAAACLPPPRPAASHPGPRVHGPPHLASSCWHGRGHTSGR